MFFKPHSNWISSYSEDTYLKNIAYGLIALIWQPENKQHEIKTGHNLIHSHEPCASKILYTALQLMTLHVGDIVYQWEAFVLILLIECCTAAIEICRSPQLINVLSDTEQIRRHPKIRESDARPLVGSWKRVIESHEDGHLRAAIYDSPNHTALLKSNYFIFSVKFIWNISCRGNTIRNVEKDS